MNIIVCLKQVPGTTKVQINPQTNTLVRQGIKSITNPFDTYALEEGVRLKERFGGKVTAITMGPPQAEEMLREAISLGADAAVMLCDSAFAGSDTWATAYTLAKAVEKVHDYDLVICGRQTMDGDTGQVSPEMAEMLKISFISYINKIEEIKDGVMRARRMVEDGHEFIEALLPAVISVTKEINIPRLPSLRGISRAKSAVIPTWTAQEISADKEKIGLTGSSTRVVKIFFPQRASHNEMMNGNTENQVTGLLTKLRGSKVI